MRKKLSVLCTTFLLPLLMTVPTFAADSSFSDVAPDAPYAESIAYLVEHGITNGTGADTFSPDAPVNRVTSVKDRRGRCKVFAGCLSFSLLQLCHGLASMD